ncbi:MAG: hypothetical protein LBL41_04570 [Bifidobacteriaceae bacterium]|jgi:hypothetical protein|nr:hypothetical protein [Bifidobacteriaceae bacterium]
MRTGSIKRFEGKDTKSTVKQKSWLNRIGYLLYNIKGVLAAGVGIYLFGLVPYILIRIVPYTIIRVLTAVGRLYYRFSPNKIKEVEMTKERFKKGVAVAVQEYENYGSKITKENLRGLLIGAQSPKNEYDFMLLMGSSYLISRLDKKRNILDAYSMLRIIEINDTPPPPHNYIVIFPAIGGKPWENKTGSDWGDYPETVLGISALQREAADKLNRLMKKYAKKHKMSLEKVKSESKIMVAGFSHGGINAAYFAENYSFEYNITQVYVAGAPIARVKIPSDINVIAYENPKDPFNYLDGVINPERHNWQTIKTKTPELDFNPWYNHNVVSYANFGTTESHDLGNLNDFLGTNQKCHNYYYVNESNVDPYVRPKMATR